MAKQSGSPFGFDFPSFDFTKMMADFKMPGLDMTAVGDAQRKNIEALTAANRKAFEGVQAVAKRQAEFMQEAMSELTTAMQQMAVTGTPEDKAAQQAEIAKAAFERAIENMRELSDMVAKANAETADLVTKRISESLDEIKALLAKHKAN
jgi:phasin family protein